MCQKLLHLFTKIHIFSGGAEKEGSLDQGDQRCDHSQASSGPGWQSASGNTGTKNKFLKWLFFYFFPYFLGYWIVRPTAC